MAWLNQFKLGRPGYENSFDINPEALQIEESQVAAFNRVLSGKGKKWIFRTIFPTIRMDSTFFTVSDRNIMASLLGVTDTFLSFKANDNFQMIGEANASIDANTLKLQENSATLLSQALVAAGASSSITVNGVYTTPPVDGVNSGTNYFTAGSYADATFTVTVGTPLPAQAYYYCNYTYTGWLVNMQAINYAAHAGWVDTMSFSGWILEGV